MKIVLNGCGNEIKQLKFKQETIFYWEVLIFSGSLNIIE
jgi:hypothetical protein